MKVVVCCNKNDFFLTRMCIASIRYYYPDIEIYLIKDYLNGEFNSTELELAMNIKVIDLGIKKFGWAASKMFLLLSNKFFGEKLLLLDSDIVFTGKLLEGLFLEGREFDFVINPEYTIADSDFVRETYYNIDYIHKYDPGFKFPGYVFNTGQMIISTGKILPSEVVDFFDINEYPYWKMQKKEMPCVDQSVLNYVLPNKEANGTLRILKKSFMVWSESAATKDLTMKNVREGNSYKSLIHWAGALRIPYIKVMTRADILSFFEEYYYSKVPFGKLKRLRRQVEARVNYNLKIAYRKLKKNLGK